MTTQRRRARDIERAYASHQYVAKLRRLADCIEKGTPFRIQVAGELISVPASAVISVEHERSGAEEELEFQLRWRRPSART